MTETIYPRYKFPELLCMLWPYSTNWTADFFFWKLKKHITSGNVANGRYSNIPENRNLSLKYFWSLLLWIFFKVFDIFQFFLEFLFWRLVVVPAIPIRVVGGCLWLFKNNTGKYHGVCFQTSNNHLWKKQHTTTKNVNVAAALVLRPIPYLSHDP